MLENEYAPSPDISLFKGEINKIYGSPGLGNYTPTIRNFVPSSLSRTRNYPLMLLNDTAKDAPKSGYIRMFLTPSCPAFGRYTKGIDIDVSKHPMAVEDVATLRKEFYDAYKEHAQRRRNFEKEYNQRNFKICSSSFFATNDGRIASGNYMNADDDLTEPLDMSISNENFGPTDNIERTSKMLSVQTPAVETSPVLMVAPVKQHQFSPSSLNPWASQPELPMPSQQKFPVKNQLRMSQASLMTFDAPIADSTYEVNNNNSGNNNSNSNALHPLALNTFQPKSTISIDDTNDYNGTISVEYDEEIDDDDDDYSDDDYSDDDDDDDGSLFGDDNNIIYDEDDLESSDADDGDFQTRWKHALDEVRSLNCHENDDAWTQRYNNLARVTSDFADIARLYAHVIITEMGMKNKADRTIPLMYMGGVAGGDKYMVIKQIMFKCPKTKSNKDDFGFSK